MCKNVGREGTASLVVILHWFRRYRKKTRGGLEIAPPPPSGARVKKWFLKKTFPKKRNFCIWWHLVFTVLGRPPIWGHRSIAEIQGRSFGYLTILIASIVIDIIATFSVNSPILTKFDLFEPCELKFHLIKNCLSIFCRTCCSLSNAV